MNLTVEVTGTGPPLVLVPGFACAPNVWFKVRRQLAESFELHMVTVPGFGGTPPLTDRPIMPKLVDLIAAYCRPLGNPVLVGHSFGGTLAFGVAARDPGPLAGAVAVDGLPFFSTVFGVHETPESMEERAQQARREILESPPREPGAKTYFDQHIPNPEDALFMNETTPNSDRVAMADLRYEGMVTDFRPEMPHIDIPVFVMGAGQPWIKSGADVEGVRQWYLQRLEGIPRLEFVLSETSGHFIMIEEPEWFVEKVTSFANEGRSAPPGPAAGRSLPT